MGVGIVFDEICRAVGHTLPYNTTSERIAVLLLERADLLPKAVAVTKVSVQFWVRATGAVPFHAVAALAVAYALREVKKDKNYNNDGRSWS